MQPRVKQALAGMDAAPLCGRWQPTSCLHPSWQLGRNLQQEDGQQCCGPPAAFVSQTAEEKWQCVRPAVGGKMKIEALAALEHGDVEYDDFAKDFYEEAPEVFAMDDKEVSQGYLCYPADLRSLESIPCTQSW